MSAEKRMSVFRASPQFLRDLFQLPEGAEIIGVHAEPGYRGVIQFYVEGCGPLTVEGGPITPVRPIAHQEVTAACVKLPLRIEWNFDAPEPVNVWGLKI